MKIPEGAFGNAIERWSKNDAVLTMLNPGVMLVTLATGEGAVEGGVIRTTLNYTLARYALTHGTRHVRQWNRLYDHGPSMFAEPDGFDHAAADRLVARAVEVGVARFFNT